MSDWPHAPAHRLGETGAYMVTAGTYRKAHHFKTPERLSLLRDRLLERLAHHGWRPQAWAVFETITILSPLPLPRPRVSGPSFANCIP